jgi:sulfur-oxidizing protein SoxY
VENLNSRQDKSHEFIKIVFIKIFFVYSGDKMNPVRRTLLKSIATVGILASAISASLIKPAVALVANWNKSAFDAKTITDAMKEAGYSGAAESSDILLIVPDIAEDGAVVPLEVTSNIPGTTSIAIFAEKNPTPLVADIQFSNGAQPYISTRIKMAETSFVRVAVRAGDKIYTQSKGVKVTLGGCGG